MKATFFKSAAEFRAWLDDNHERRSELLVGFYKKDSGRPSVTWPEAVDQALCYGWIDGVRKRLDDDAYTVRFTPRRPSSRWSVVNIRRVGELKKLGQMQPAGLKAFAEAGKKSRNYSYEQRKTAALEAEHEKQFRGNRKAWEFFEAQPPWYRRTATWWVISAKKEDTRANRLARLVADCEQGRRILAIPERTVPKRQPK
jgi:uncharacterized protein YdeI (YjbR/CyaY-like superfamily)